MIGSIAVSLVLLQLASVATAQAGAACGCANTTASCGAGNTCKDNVCQKLTLPMLPTGVLDGTPACLRGAGECCGSGSFCQTGQICEKNACIDKSECPRPCDKTPCGADEYCVDDAKSSTAYRCEKATPCGCADPAAKCGSGFSCKANKCQPLRAPTLPAGVLDGTPGCVRMGGECCGAGVSCAAGEVCESDQCIAASKCPAPPATCASKPCATGEKCIDEPKECLLPPCPQFRCEKQTTTTTTACDANSCAPDQICIEDPKTCDTTPCPQFRCEGVKVCGCFAPTVKCDSGMTCKDNKCQPLRLRPTPVGIFDGSPACVRGAGECCGDVASPAVCSSDQVCESNKCVAASTCPTPGTCHTCKTAGIKAYFDGCNQCSCEANGDAACTLKACAAVVTDAKSCVSKCDGFLTDDDGACGRCTCINGQKTACSKAGTKECTAADNGDRQDREDKDAASSLSLALGAILALALAAML